MISVNIAPLVSERTLCEGCSPETKWMRNILSYWKEEFLAGIIFEKYPLTHLTEECYLFTFAHPSTEILESCSLEWKIPFCVKSRFFKKRGEGGGGGGRIVAGKVLRLASFTLHIVKISRRFSLISVRLGKDLFMRKKVVPGPYHPSQLGLNRSWACSDCIKQRSHMLWFSRLLALPELSQLGEP